MISPVSASTRSLRGQARVGRQAGRGLVGRGGRACGAAAAPNQPLPSLRLRAAPALLGGHSGPEVVHEVTHQRVFANGHHGRGRGRRRPRAHVAPLGPLADGQKVKLMLAAAAVGTHGWLAGCLPAAPRLLLDSVVAVPGRLKEPAAGAGGGRGGVGVQRHGERAACSGCARPLPPLLARTCRTRGRRAWSAGW